MKLNLAIIYCTASTHMLTCLKHIPPHHKYELTTKIMLLIRYLLSYETIALFATPYISTPDFQ